MGGVVVGGVVVGGVSGSGVVVVGLVMSMKPILVFSPPTWSMVRRPSVTTTEEVAIFVFTPEEGVKSRIAAPSARITWWLSE